MFPTRARLVLALVAISCLAAAATARAQDAAGRKKGNQQAAMVAGTIKGLAAGILQVTATSGDEYLVRLPAQPRAVSLVGTAEPGWLKPGMLVRFTATFDKKGKPVAPVGDVGVFTPRTPMDVPGVTSATAPTGGGAGIANPFNEAPAPPKDTPPPETVALRIVGQIVGLKNGEMAVAAGATTVKVQLADNVRISVDIADLSYARVGDKVDARGILVQPGQVAATRLTVTPAAPLGSTAKPDAAPKATE